MSARTAIVIGASAGFGLAVCRRLKQEGTRVFGVSRRAPPADAVEAAVSCDVTDHAELTRVLKELAAKAQPDLVVYSAGEPVMGSTLETPIEHARRAFDVNFWAFDTTIRALAPTMRGSIVAISSIAALIGLPNHAYYGASKAALDRYCESLDHELGPRGVRVKVLHVGYVDTGFFHRGGWHGTKPPDGHKGSGVSVEEVANAVVALADGRARTRILGWRERAIATAERAAPGAYSALVRWRTR